MIAIELFWPLYLGSNCFLQYIVYGFWVRNFSTSLASSDLSDYLQMYIQEVTLPVIATLQYKNSLIQPWISITSCS